MNKEEVFDQSELVKEYLRVKGYTKTLENLEIEEKQQKKTKVIQIEIILF